MKPRSQSQRSHTKSQFSDTTVPGETGDFLVRPRFDLRDGSFRSVLDVTIPNLEKRISIQQTPEFAYGNSSFPTSASRGNTDAYSTAMSSSGAIPSMPTNPLAASPSPGPSPSPLKMALRASRLSRDLSLDISKGDRGESATKSDDLVGKLQNGIRYVTRPRQARLSSQQLPPRKLSRRETAANLRVSWARRRSPSLKRFTIESDDSTAPDEAVETENWRLVLPGSRDSLGISYTDLLQSSPFHKSGGLAPAAVGKPPQERAGSHGGPLVERIGSARHVRSWARSGDELLGKTESGYSRGSPRGSPEGRKENEGVSGGKEEDRDSKGSWEDDDGDYSVYI